MFHTIPKIISDDLRVAYAAFQQAERDVQQRWNYIVLLGGLPEGAVLQQIREDGVIYAVPQVDG